MKQKSEILASNATKYLKYCMMLRQQFISRGIDVKTRDDIPKIDYNTFMEEYGILTNSIDSINSASKVSREDLNYIRNELVKKRNEFVKYYYKYVVISEEQIDELMKYIEQSILITGIDELGQYTASSFLINQLDRLVGYMIKNNKNNTKDYKNIIRWYSFLCSKDNIAIDYLLDNLMYFDPSKDFDTLINLVNNNLLMLNNLYVGRICKKDENNQIKKEFSVVSVSTKDGKRVMQSIFSKNTYYSLEPSNEDEYFELDESIEELFNYMRLNALNSNIYDKHYFINQIIPAFNEYYSMPIEEKDKLDKVVDFIVNWWVNYICELDNSNIKNTKIEKFKEYFSDELKVRLLMTPNKYTIYINEIDEPLYNSLLKTQIKLSVESSRRPVMIVTTNDIRLKYGYYEDETILANVADINKSKYKTKTLV